jgi:hypothetical protein
MNRKQNLPAVAALMAAMTAACSDSASQTPTPTEPSRAIQLAIVQAVTITPRVAALRTGQTQQYDLHVVLGEGPPPSLGVPYWSTSDPSVVTIDPSGRALARTAGTAILTATVHGGQGTLEVRVSN